MRGYGYQRSGVNPIVIIIIINVVMLIATYINQEFIISNFGLWPAFFLEQPWTILTSMFVHGSFGHLFGNMITLFFFGGALSQLVGERRFLLVYFVGGILGNVLYLFLGHPFIPAVGASGAVYAIAGALVVMVPRLPIRLYFIFPMPLWVVVLIFMVLFSFIPGIAWQAHLGGLAFGLVAGYFFRRGKPRFYLR